MLNTEITNSVILVLQQAFFFVWFLNFSSCNFEDCFGFVFDAKKALGKLVYSRFTRNKSECWVNFFHYQAFILCFSLRRTVPCCNFSRSWENDRFGVGTHDALEWALLWKVKGSPRFWRDGSVLRSASCSSTGPRLHSWHQYGSTQPSTTTVLKDPMPSSGLWGTRNICGAEIYV